MKRQHFGVRRSAEHGEQIHLACLRQITPQSCALRGPRDFKTPGRNEFAREQGFCLRQKRLDAPKGAGPLRGPSAICRDCISNLKALSSKHGEQIHLTGLRQIAPQSCALRGPRDFKTPGRSEFAREQGFCLRQKRLDAPKGAGPPCGPFGDLLGLYFKLEGALIQTWRTNPSGWSPANRRRHPRPSAARCGFWRP